MTCAFVGFGSNLGDPRLHFQNAKTLLSEVPGFLELRTSPLYWSEPLVKSLSSEQKPDWYLNAVFQFESDLPIREIFAKLCEIEKQLGRDSGKGLWLPRTVDLDFLFYGDLVYEDQSLRLPHPEIANRRFVLKPLADLAPNQVHPQLGKTVTELLAKCPDTLKVEHA